MIINAIFVYLPAMEQYDKTPVLYQRIGEFAVSFQWLESRVREIGWLIHDPQRAQWPPLILRQVTNQVLLNVVHDMFIAAMDEINNADALDRKEPFRSLIDRLHRLRRQRNNLLHSAYIELKSGGEVQDILMANPKVQYVDDEVTFDVDVLTPEKIQALIEEAAHIGFALNIHYTQLIHWSDQLPRLQ